MLCSEWVAKKPKSESGVIKPTLSYGANPLALDSGFTFLYMALCVERRESTAGGGGGRFLLRCSDVTHK